MMSDKANLLDIDSMMDVVAMYKCKFCDHTMESSAAMKNHISEHLLPARNLSYSQVDFYPMHIVKSKSIRFYPFSNIWEGMECTVQCCFFFICIRILFYSLRTRIQCQLLGISATILKLSTSSVQVSLIALKVSTILKHVITVPNLTI